MPFEFVRYEKRGRIAYVTINRPEVMNALHPPANDELSSVWDEFAADPDTWVAILTGAGERAFSAGNDLKWTATHGMPRMPKGGFGGIAGGPEKCAWITDELGFDAWIDYKSEDVAARLRETCPDGIDVFFDNVGGEILDAVLGQINLHARIALCGAISQYDTAELSPGPRNFINLIPQRGRVEGFILLDSRDRFLDGILQLCQWVQDGRIRYAEDIVDGLENAPAAFRRLFSGENTGKLIVKVAD